MLDLQALTTALETDTRYQASVTSGSNSELLALLSADHPIETTFRTLARQQILGAIGDELQNITEDNLNRLRILMPPGEPVDLADANTRAELQRILPTAARTRLAGMVQRAKTYGEVASGDRVTLRDVRDAVKLIPTSYYNRYMRGEV